MAPAMPERRCSNRNPVSALAEENAEWRIDRRVSSLSTRTLTSVFHDEHGGGRMTLLRAIMAAITWLGAAMSAAGIAFLLVWLATVLGVLGEGFAGMMPRELLYAGLGLGPLGGLWVLIGRRLWS